MQETAEAVIRETAEAVMQETAEAVIPATQGAKAAILEVPTARKTKRTKPLEIFWMSFLDKISPNLIRMQGEQPGEA